MSVKAKLLSALSLILLATFVVTSLVNYRVTRDAVREELLNSALPLTGKNIYSEIHSDLMRPILVSSSMATDTFLKDWVLNGEKDPEKLTKYLKEIQTNYNFLTAFFVSAISDYYYYQEGILKKVGPRDSHDVWFYSFLQTRKKYELDVDTNESENHKLTIFMNFRIEDDNGKLLGVTGVGVNMDHAAALLADAQKRYNRNVYLVDQDGLVQVHSDVSLIKKRYITEAPGINAIAKDILKNKDGSVNFEYDLGEEHMLLSTHYIPEFSWHLIVEQKESSALVTARNNLIRTIAIGVGASILIIIICVITVNHLQCRLELMAKSDPLTGAANRRALEERYALASYKAERYDEPFSVIILDLDDFKQINDSQGHVAGDKILKEVSMVIREAIRPSDLLVRWGGDEFLVMLDGDHGGARVLAKRIHDAVDRAPNIPVTFSCGIAKFENGDTLDSLTRRADQALYSSKKHDADWITTDKD
jgi:diguanylate cyclase (GGDEF)-like protein